jgi:hypothetical protein
MHFSTNRAPTSYQLSNSTSHPTIRSSYPRNHSSTTKSSHPWILLGNISFTTASSSWRLPTVPTFHSHVGWHWEGNYCEGDLSYSGWERSLASPKNYLNGPLKFLRFAKSLSQHLLCVPPWINTFTEPNKSIIHTSPPISCSCLCLHSNGHQVSK